MAKNKKFRKDGIIPELKKASYPTNFLFYDTETTPIIADDGKEYQKLKLGIARYIRTNKSGKIIKDEQIVFRDTETFFRFCMEYIREKTKLYIFAHNIAFDIMVLDLPSYLMSIGIKTTPPIQANAMFLWRVKTGKGTLEFINTGNYVMRPLADIGEDLGIEKLKIDFDNTTESELITYCIRDVEILKVFIFNMIQWLRDNNLGGFKSTVASLAFSVYRYKFMNTPIVIHNNPTVIRLERRGYKGGRTEAHKIGNFNSVIYGYYDINSMYPYVMKDENLPSKYLGYIHRPSYDELLEYMEKYYVICDCEIETDKPFYGLKYDKNIHHITNSDKEPLTSKLFFPTGHISDVFHHDELLYAIKHGMVKHINGFAFYKRGNLFNDYVDFFTEMKVKASEDNNKTDRLFSKLMLNSLYGKFGQKYKTTKYIGNVRLEFETSCAVVDKNGHEICTQIIWMGKVYHAITDGESTYSFPAIAGAITAKARMLLWSYIERVNIHNVFYVDTDSIITNIHGFNALKNDLHQTRLGALALEKASNHLTINGAKDYRFSGERVLKGIPKKAQEIAPNRFKFLQFEGFKTWRNRGASGSPRTWMQVKQKINEYDKGVLSVNGDVEPYNIYTTHHWVTKRLI